MLAAKDAEIAALEEQLRDMQFYFATQKTIGESALRQEIADGQLYVLGNDEPADGKASVADARARLRSKMRR